MPKVREIHVEKLLIRLCEAEGWECCKLVDVGNTGFPDRTVLKSDGVSFFVETKKPKGGRLRGKQAYRIKKLREKNFRVYIPYTKAEVEELVEKEKIITLASWR